MTTEFKSGDVINYHYLWRREADKGETEGRKSRPACVVIALEMQGKTYLYLFAITSKRPLSSQTAIEIPNLEMRRIGLKTDAPGWVVVSEYNRDILGESFYLQPNEPKMGNFSSRFLLLLQQALRENLRQPSALVKRST